MAYYSRNSSGRRYPNNNWRRNRNIIRRNKNQRPRTRRTAVPPTRKSVNRSSTIGSFMKTAASSIISAIPGASILKDVADFIFKAVKVQGLSEKDGFSTPQQAIIGLNQILVLKRVHFITNSPEVRVLDGIPSSKTEEEKKRHIRDQYIAYNIKEINIELKPQNDLGSRQGQWAMVFIPFVSTDHENSLRTDYTSTFVGYNDILKMEGAVSGQQTQSLKIKYSPQAHDGRAFFAAASSDNYGMLLISYQDFAKATASEFTPQDFAATLLLNAIVRKLNRRARVYTIVSVEYESLLTEVEEFVYDQKRVYVVSSQIQQATTSLRRVQVNETSS